MKTNCEMCNGGRIKPEYAATWATYYCRYVQEYEREGIPIWGLTMQNEPLAVQRWESCIYTPEDARAFIRDHLGPALERSGLSDIRLLACDHNRDRVYEYVKPIFDDPEAGRFICGNA